MRFSFVVLALASVVASASALRLSARQSLPTCANACITGANFDGCDPSDDGCLCRDQKFVSSVTTCIESSCQGSDLTNAETFAQQLCLQVGVTLATSSTSGASDSSSASTTTSASNSTGSATTTAPSTSTASATTTSSSSSSPSSTSNAAVSHGTNAIAGLAALGLIALVL